jgi:hypothetical protein
MRSESQGGTRPPCSGRSAMPERFIAFIVKGMKVAGAMTNLAHR